MMKYMKICSAIVFAIVGLSLGAAELSIPFLQEEAADWSQTRGTTFSFKDHCILLDGTTTDSKIWRLVELKTETKYKLTATARGPVSIRLTNGKWSKEDTYLTLNFNNRDFAAKTVSFQLPETLFKQQFLVIQVAKDRHAEVKAISFQEVTDTTTEDGKK